MTTSRMKALKRPRPAVLVVEDDPALRKLVRTHLERMGAQVTEAPDGKTAMDHVAKSDFALVCLDLMLPESSGYEVCEYMRGQERTRNVPILVMSARTLPEDRAYAEEVGANGYLVKPFTKDDFVARVGALLKA